MSELWIKSSTRISVGVDDCSCFSTFYYCDPNFTLYLYLYNPENS